MSFWELKTNELPANKSKCKSRGFKLPSFKKNDKNSKSYKFLYDIKEYFLQPSKQQKVSSDAVGRFEIHQEMLISSMMNGIITIYNITGEDEYEVHLNKTRMK